MYATKGTAEVLAQAACRCTVVEQDPRSRTTTPITLLESGKIDYIVSTSSKGRIPTRDSVKIRRKAVERSIPCLTSIDTANALADSLRSRYSQDSTELVDINHMRAQEGKLRFSKMQGCGNDYIYFNCLNQKIDNPEGLSVRLSDRHLASAATAWCSSARPTMADARMRMFNLDGSEGKMCGNAIRCVGKYLYDKGHGATRMTMTIDTLSGVKTVSLVKRTARCTWRRWTWGRPLLSPASIPVKLGGDRIVSEPITVGGEEYRITCVSMGNPHCVVFCNHGQPGSGGCRAAV